MRCYDGCWDSKAQALFAKGDALMRSVASVEPEAHCTYFPGEQCFQVHVWGRPLSGFLSSRLAALQEAANRLGVG